MAKFIKKAIGRSLFCCIYSANMMCQTAHGLESEETSKLSEIFCVEMGFDPAGF